MNVLQHACAAICSGDHGTRVAADRVESDQAGVCTVASGASPKRARAWCCARSPNLCEAHQASQRAPICSLHYPAAAPVHQSPSSHPSASVLIASLFALPPRFLRCTRQLSLDAFNQADNQHEYNLQPHWCLDRCARAHAGSRGLAHWASPARSQLSAPPSPATGALLQGPRRTVRFRSSTLPPLALVALPMCQRVVRAVRTPFRSVYATPHSHGAALGLPALQRRRLLCNRGSHCAVRGGACASRVALVLSNAPVSPRAAMWHACFITFTRCDATTLAYRCVHVRS